MTRPALAMLNGHPAGPDEVVVLRPDIAAALDIKTETDND